LLQAHFLLSFLFSKVNKKAGSPFLVSPLLVSMPFLALFSREYVTYQILIRLLGLTLLLQRFVVHGFPYPIKQIKTPRQVTREALCSSLPRSSRTYQITCRCSVRFLPSFLET
jgi:hypothetical protein